MADDIQAADFRLLACVFGIRWQWECSSRPYDDAAIALVEPFRLHARLTGGGLSAFHTPFENFHGVGQSRFVTSLLVHFISRRGTTQVGQARTANQHMGRVRMIQRRQDAQLGQ